MCMCIAIVCYVLVYGMYMYVCTIDVYVLYVH